MRTPAMTAPIAACGITSWAQIGNVVVTEAAGFQRGVPWPGSIASLFCTGLTGISGIVSADRYPLPLELAGVRVKVGGAQAPLFAVAQLGGYQQINLQVPWEAAFADETDVVVEQGAQQATARVPRVTTIASFFRLPDGSGAFQHAVDHSLAHAGTPPFSAAALARKQRSDRTPRHSAAELEYHRSGGNQ
jgi:uncharacterized protein (TIGR03437 family)